MDTSGGGPPSPPLSIRRLLVIVVALQAAPWWPQRHNQTQLLAEQQRARAKPCGKDVPGVRRKKREKVVTKVDLRFFFPFLLCSLFFPPRPSSTSSSFFLFLYLSLDLVLHNTAPIISHCVLFFPFWILYSLCLSPSLKVGAGRFPSKKKKENRRCLSRFHALFFFFKQKRKKLISHCPSASPSSDLTATSREGCLDGDGEEDELGECCCWFCSSSPCCCALPLLPCLRRLSLAEEADDTSVAALRPRPRLPSRLDGETGAPISAAAAQIARAVSRSTTVGAAAAAAAAAASSSLPRLEGVATLLGNGGASAR